MAKAGIPLDHTSPGVGILDKNAIKTAGRLWGLSFHYFVGFQFRKTLVKRQRYLA